MKKSDSYRSIEERVGTAYENVKVSHFFFIERIKIILMLWSAAIDFQGKVASRSGSVHSFAEEDSLTAPQSPTIPEGKTIPWFFLPKIEPILMMMMMIKGEWIEKCFKLFD